VGWIGGVVGGITAYRLLRRRSQAAPEPASPASDERAQELRAKLAESKLTESSKPTEPVVENTPAEPVAEQEPEPESPDDRRRRVHEEGRAALDEMKSDGADG